MFTPCVACIPGERVLNCPVYIPALQYDTVVTFLDYR